MSQIELSSIGIDTVELRKRFKQHKLDINYINNNKYVDFKDKCSQIRQKKIHFNKSLNSLEMEYIHKLQMKELGE